MHSPRSLFGFDFVVFEGGEQKHPVERASDKLAGANQSSRIVTGGKVRAVKRLPRKSHTCSMGLRSENHAGQSIRSISSLSKSCSAATVR
ncbi:hypothetical protein TNCV_5027381 [Trichonephila clavipes]|nr:hypothetical protein TNCV_5027381 [Trichonephila clavipes]